MPLKNILSFLLKNRGGYQRRTTIFVRPLLINGRQQRSYVPKRPEKYQFHIRYTAAVFEPLDSMGLGKEKQWVKR